MNKLIKIIIAMFGAANEVFVMVTPILLSITVIVLFNLSGFNSGMLIVVGLMSTLFRAIKPLIK